MTFKSVHLVNIQSHANTLLEFPPTGVIRIAGNNSAGKSTIFKPLLYAMTGGLNVPETRAGLVSFGAQFGEATYTLYDGTELIIHVTLAAATTWISLSKRDCEPIKRYHSDKTYKELITEFGMHYSDTRDISLNYSSGDGVIHFFTTSHRTNGEMVSMALTDKVAETALERMSATLDQARQIQDSAASVIPVLQETLQTLVTYDIDVIMEKKERYMKDYEVLSKIYFPTIPEIHAVPVVNILSVHVPSIPKIVYPTFYDVNFKIPNIIPVAKEFREVMEGRCPTCGRSFSSVS